MEDLEIRNVHSTYCSTSTGVRVGNDTGPEAARRRILADYFGRENSLWMRLLKMNEGFK